MRSRVRPAFSYVRTGITALAVLMLLPLFVMTVAPLLGLLTPVALVALPFMLASFSRGASDAHMETRRIDSWRAYNLEHATAR